MSEDAASELTPAEIAVLFLLAETPVERRAVAKLPKWTVRRFRPRLSSFHAEARTRANMSISLQLNPRDSSETANSSPAQEPRPPLEGSHVTRDIPRHALHPETPGPTQGETQMKPPENSLPCRTADTKLTPQAALAHYERIIKRGWKPWRWPCCRYTMVDFTD